MSYEFHPEALSEFRESAVFYESQQFGLGARFIAAVQSSIDRIIVAPLSCRVMEEEVRRCLTKVFPYAVLYTVESDCIVIVAVMHCYREPGCWHHRTRVV